MCCLCDLIFSLQYWKTVKCSYDTGLPREQLFYTNHPLSQLLFDNKRILEVQLLIAIKALKEVFVSAWLTKTSN